MTSPRPGETGRATDLAGQDVAFLGQLDLVVLEVREGRGDVALGQLVVHVGRADLRGAVREEGLLLAAARWSRRRRWLGAQLAVAPSDVRLDHRDVGLGVRDLAGDPVQLDLGQVVLLPEVVTCALIRLICLRSWFALARSVRASKPTRDARRRSQCKTHCDHSQNGNIHRKRLSSLLAVASEAQCARRQSRVKATGCARSRAGSSD